MGIRSRARTSSLQILYQIEVGKVSYSFAIQDYFNGKNFSPSRKEFSEFLVKGVTGNLADLDQIISRYTKNWNISRMAVIDRNILRMGVLEFYHAEDIPPRVTINECVELAKKFGDVDSPKFINGILDSIYKNEKIEKNKS